MAKSEDTFIEWLTSRTRARAAGVLVGIGDDMAALEIEHCSRGAAEGRQANVLVTADMLMDGVDFDTSVHTPEQIGRKSLAASLSDCAAMAVQPRHVLVSVALPEAWSMARAKRLLLGIEKLAAKYGCAIVGGDTNSWRHPLAIDVIVIAAPWKDSRPTRRNGVRVGDAICTTGTLGGSLTAPHRRGKKAAPHHLSFEPRVHEAHWIAANLETHLHAMMDLSDGLSTDARRMAAASGCGIEFDAVALTNAVSEAAVRASRKDGRSTLDHVLNDGEDFELLFAVDEIGLSMLRKPRMSKRDKTARPPERWTRIGVAIKNRGVWLRREDGRRERTEARGWQHFKNA